MKKRARRPWIIPVAATLIALAGIGGYIVVQSRFAGMGGRHMMGSGMMAGNAAAGSSASHATGGSFGEQAFKHNCSICHGAPSTTYHTAAQWPAVVKKMEQRMSAYGLQVPDEKTSQAIVHYLQAHAAH